MIQHKIHDIAIVGGGPGGIGSAVEAKAHGIEKILLIEKSENHSDTIRKYYKDNKRVDKDWKGQSIALEGNVDFFDGTKESTLNYFEKLLDNDEIDYSFNTEVENIKKLDDYFEINSSKGVFKALNVIVTIGKMGKPNKPSYKIPMSLKNNINFNLDKCSQGEKILVVGGGDTASEYAYELAEHNIVTLVYRKATFSRLSPKNEEILKRFNGEEKLRLRLATDILSIDNENGKVKVEFDDGYFTIYDRVIYAIGGSTPVDFLTKCGIKVNEKGSPIFDKNFQTNVRGLYVAGDIAFDSGGSIVMALNHAYHITNHIIKEKGKIYAVTDRIVE